MKLLIILVLSIVSLISVRGHGRVLDPAARGSMWRMGYSEYPVNYDDHGNFCGGMYTQWNINGGKCGLCGDSYSSPQPRDNELGGKYGLGVIVKTYPQGSVLDAFVQLTAVHKGYFEFSVCSVDSGVESEECFEQWPLSLIDGSSKFQVVSPNPQDYNIALRLPANLTCQHCVFRWHYRTGNSWGVCDDGTGAMGCGAQETFRTCSDIAILPNTN